MSGALVQPNCMKANCVRPGTTVPVMVVPIQGYPIPAYLQLREPLCSQHAAEFTMADYDSYQGGWYEAACDQIRAYRKPGKVTEVQPVILGEQVDKLVLEPYTVNPDYEPAPKDECYLVMVPVERAEQGPRPRQGGRIV